MHPATTILAAHPLLDLDLTVFVQFGLFLLLLVISNALLFQPYLRLRERRRLNIEGAREDATKTSAQADAKLADYEKQLAAARDRANEAGRKVRAEAAAHERDVTDKARSTAHAAIDEANKKMRAEAEAARLSLLPQANTLAKQIVGKLLGREVA